VDGVFDCIQDALKSGDEVRLTGFGVFVVAERKAGATGKMGGALGSLPAVSLDGITAHELATQLGTIVAWQNNGVSTTIAGSIPTAAAEAAARELR
jgi:hypothetical protein